MAAMRMLAEIAVRVGRDSDAEKLLRRCLSLAPKFSGARYNYAVLMHRMNKPAEALAEVEALLLEDPEKPSYRNLIGVILSRIGEYERSSDYYKSLVSDYSDKPKIWLSYAHVLTWLVLMGEKYKARFRVRFSHSLLLNVCVEPVSSNGRSLD